MDKQLQYEKARRFLELHHAEEMLILPNIWDPLGALLLEDLGYAAVATASAAVAFSLGYDDGEKIKFSTMLEAIRRISSAVHVPVTADIENGYADEPEAVADHIRDVIRAGAVGINIEDSTIKDDSLRAIDSQCERIAAIRGISREEGIPLVINARVDVFMQQSTRPKEKNLAEGMDRAKAYVNAGADCIYPILLSDPDSLKRISEESGAPLNVYATPSLPPLSELKSAGVKRLSLGPGFLKAALTFMKKAALELKNTGNLDLFTRDVLSTADIRKLVTPHSEE